MKTVPFLKFYDKSFRELNFWEMHLEKKVTNPSFERVAPKPIYDLFNKTLIHKAAGAPLRRLIIHVKKTEYHEVKTILDSFESLENLKVISGIKEALITGEKNDEQYGTLWWLTFMTSGYEWKNKSTVLKDVNPLIADNQECSILDFINAIKYTENHIKKCRSIYKLFQTYVKFTPETKCGQKNLIKFPNGLTEKEMIIVRLSLDNINEYVFNENAGSVSFQKHLIGLQNSMDFAEKNYPDVYKETKELYEKTMIKPPKSWLLSS